MEVDMSCLKATGRYLFWVVFWSYKWPEQINIDCDIQHDMLCLPWGYQKNDCGFGKCQYDASFFSDARSTVLDIPTITTY